MSIADFLRHRVEVGRHVLNFARPFDRDALIIVAARNSIGGVGNVIFINDSKATNADSTEKALLSFPQNVFWILGGKPKEGGIESLRPYFPGIVRAYLIGAASEEFARTLDGDVAIIPCGTLDIALARAAADAESFPSPRALHSRGEGRDESAR